MAVEHKFNIKEVEVKELNPEDSTVEFELDKCTITVKGYVEETVAHIKEVNKQVKDIKTLKLLNSVFTKMYIVFISYVIIAGSYRQLQFLAVYVVAILVIAMIDKAKVEHLKRKTSDTNAALNKLDLVPVILTDSIEVLEVSRQRVIIKGVRQLKDSKVLTK